MRARGRGGRAARAERAADKLGCEPVFLYTETTHRGWDNPTLVRDVCDAIERVRPRVVITHSMGGVVMATGVHRKVSGCARIVKADAAPGKDGAVWIASQAPWRGAASADLCVSVCGQDEKATEKRVEEAVSALRDSQLPLLEPIFDKFSVPILVKWFSAGLCNCVDGAEGAKRVPEAHSSLQTIYVSPHRDGLQFSCPPGEYRTKQTLEEALQVVRRSHKTNQRLHEDKTCIQVSSVAREYAHALLCGLWPWSITKLHRAFGLAIAAPIIDSVVPGGWGVDRKTATPSRGTTALSPLNRAAPTFSAPNSTTPTPRGGSTPSRARTRTAPFTMATRRSTPRRTRSRSRGSRTPWKRS